MKDYYTIGQVSKLLGVSSDTLRYYDKIGLTKVRINPQNKYRYYEMEDIHLLTIVLGARSLQFPIEDIKKCLSNVSIDSYYEFLEKEENEVKSKLKLLTETMASINEAKTYLNKVRDFENNYSLDKLIVKNSKKDFIKVKSNYLIEELYIKRFVRVVETNLKKAEYFVEFKRDDEKNYIDYEYVYIEVCEMNYDFLQYIFTTSPMEYEKITLCSDIILANFFGTKEDFNDYIDFLSTSINIDKNLILVKTLNYFPSDTAGKYFIELIISLN